MASGAEDFEDALKRGSEARARADEAQTLRAAELKLQQRRATATADAAQDHAVRRLADATSAFVLRAKQATLPMVVEQHYELFTRRRTRQWNLVRVLPMWALDGRILPPMRSAPLYEHDPAYDEYFVTEDHEIRTLRSRRESAWGEKTERHYWPTRTLARVTPGLADVLIQKMAEALLYPERHKARVARRLDVDTEGQSVFLVPDGRQSPSGDWITAP